MVMPVYPVIVVPGITASYLQDEYALPPDTVWSVLTKEYERVGLHPDNRRYEAQEPARVVRGQVFEVAYRELIEELRHNLTDHADEPVPVYPFAYDWRQPLATNEQLLKEFVDEVIARTRLLRHYDRAGYGADPKVNLVGHSMGGLVIAGYLKRAGIDARVHKVATLATPFQGSFEAVLKVTTGTAALGNSVPSSREREAARLTPALYELMPGFANGLNVDDGLPNSLFEPALWQPSIVDTIEEYIRLHGLDTTNTAAQAASIFGELLNDARLHRDELNSLSLADCRLIPSSWLCVVGVNSETRVRLQVKKAADGPAFVFSSNDRDDQWGKGDAAQQRFTGDGTVPFEGALPRFLKPENLVCVTPADFGYWEVQDRVLAAASGFHGILPNMDMLHRMIVAHFFGRPAQHGNIWGRLAPGVAARDWPIDGMDVKNSDAP